MPCGSGSRSRSHSWWGRAVGSVWAFSCPTLVKAANEAIAAAEPKANMGDDRQKLRNAGMIEEAKALSKEAEKYLAEQVK